MKIIIYLMCLLPVLAFGQKVEPEALSSAGDHMEVTNLNLDWTLGENAVETIGTGDNRLTQGFQQGDLNYTTSIVTVLPEFALRAFPNPTTQFLILEKDNAEPYQVWMTDVQGVVVMKKTITNYQTEINLSGLPSGMYLIAVTKSKELVQWIKIEKI